MNATGVYLIKRPRTLSNGKRKTYFVLRWYGTDGREFSESLGRTDKMTKRVAEQARREKEMKIGSGKIRRDKPRRMTLNEFLTADQMAITGDVRESTLIEYKIAARHASDALGKDTELCSIGLPQVGKLKKHLHNLGRRRATVRKTLSMLRAAFNRALKQGLIHSNPFADLGLARIESRPKRIFSQSEIAAMISVSPDLWWQSFIKLAVTSGLRRGELLNLQWENIDFEKGTVSVQGKQSELFEVAGYEYKTWDWLPKAKASCRTVPLPNDTIDFLRRMLVKAGGSPYVFLGLERITVLNRRMVNGSLPAKFDLMNNMTRHFTEIQRRAADNGSWRVGCIHDLRRTYCTWMADVVPMHVLKEWAGHSDIATTSAFYLSVSDSVADRARQALSAVSCAV